MRDWPKEKRKNLTDPKPLNDCVYQNILKENLIVPLKKEREKKTIKDGKVASKCVSNFLSGQ